MIKMSYRMCLLVVLSVLSCVGAAAAPSLAAPPPETNCVGLADKKEECTTKVHKCQNKSMKKCKRNCKKDAKKKTPRCKKTCCELGF